MKTKMLKAAYRTEDGYVFECENYDDFSKILRVLGTSFLSREAVSMLKAKGIPFRMYKDITTF